MDEGLGVGALLQVAGPMFFMGMQASQVKTALEIQQKKSVGVLNPIPFTSMLVNCLIWTLYGSLKSDNTIMVPNVTGLLVGMYVFK